MGWFDEQIRERKRNDDDAFAEAFYDIAGAVTGKRVFFDAHSDRENIKNEIDKILKYYNLKSRELPDSVEDIDDSLEYILHPLGIMRRSVELKDEWYKNAAGPMLAKRAADGKVSALIPDKLSRLVFVDKESGKRVRITRKNASLFKRDAICFYKPFPLKEMNVRELGKCVFSCVSRADVRTAAIATLAVMLVGMIIPALYNVIFSSIIVCKSMQPLFAVAVFLVCVNISAAVMTSGKKLLTARIASKMNLSAEASVMMRILSLPASFFKKHSAGGLSSKLQWVDRLCENFANAVISTGLTALFSLVYIIQMIIYGKGIWLYAMLVILVSLLFSAAVSLAEIKNIRSRMQCAAKEKGASYALITRIQKIKLSGAEKRAFSLWGKAYAKSAAARYNPPFIIKVSNTLSVAITLFGGILIYLIAARTQIPVADFYAFNSAYGIVSGAFAALSGTAFAAAGIKPVLDELKLFYEAKPEISDEKQVVSSISGEIELNNVSFRYSEDMPEVINNLSLKIRPGQYVAIVGKTGCGKSTLMRLMLGFEKPNRGAVYYDGKDLEKLDLKSLRQKIGVVLQEGKLFQGDIFSNIAISTPNLTLDGAWEAAEMAGIADDIRNMPMGMHTIISEGSGGISGGQRQRLLIARAIAAKPKILMFDEATSALDNITQKNVSESLDKLKCTRIVIAHRLSTIKQCERIIVLDKGKVAEDGTYDELVNMGGIFAELVKRQKVS